MHVQADEFIHFVAAAGFIGVAETGRHDIYGRGTERIQSRRSATLTQAEVDGICDAADLDPPPMQSFFGV